MARHSKVSKLPKVIRDWLDRALIEANFQDYDLMVAEVEARGYCLSRAAICRHGRQLKRRTQRIREFNLAAEVLDDAAHDGSAKREGAVMALLQTEVFEILMQLEETANDKDREQRLKLLSGLSKQVATLARASIRQKQWAVEHAVLERAANVAAQAATEGGFSAEQAASLRARVLGLSADDVPAPRAPTSRGRPRSGKTS